jgi:hypothetical protein
MTKKPTLADQLRARIAADPTPEKRHLTQQPGSAQVARNRARLGLPELPTDAERAAWAKLRKTTTATAVLLAMLLGAPSIHAESHCHQHGAVIHCH